MPPLSSATLLCADRQLHDHIRAHGRPQTAVVTAFDSAYVAEGAKVSLFASELSLPFVGYCADAQCAPRFRSLRAPPHAAAEVVATCNTSAVEAQLRRLPSTRRCAGWRRVQFVKVWGVHDVLLAGVDVLLLDGDRSRPALAQLRLMQRGNTRIDTFVDSRDPAPWPGFWNFGYAYMRATAANRAIFASLSRVVLEHWDQAGWNFVMRAYEDRSLFTCRPMRGRCWPDECGRAERPPAVTGRGSVHFLPVTLPSCPLVAEQPLCLCGLENRWNVASWIGYLHEQSPLDTQIPRCGRETPALRTAALQHG
ncbi:hypothetical protein AB1Y20_005948 [Prymnesium parvum]|uniref:Protein xylosyltransferase n=1 Tax=Prymnesium parvum TaxID=97485 RepID=A0AB34J0V2_PRYPA